MWNILAIMAHAILMTSGELCIVHHSIMKQRAPESLESQGSVDAVFMIIGSIHVYI